VAEIKNKSVEVVEVEEQDVKELTSIKDLSKKKQELIEKFQKGRILDGTYIGRCINITDSEDGKTSTFWFKVLTSKGEIVKGVVRDNFIKKLMRADGTPVLNRNGEQATINEVESYFAKVANAAADEDFIGKPLSVVIRNGYIADLGKDRRTGGVRS